MYQLHHFYGKEITMLALTWFTEFSTVGSHAK